MRKRRRREVTVETDEVWLIRRSANVVIAWCPECGEGVRMITPEEAAILASLSLRTIYRRVEAGLIHYIEVPEGFLLICANSIAHLVQAQADLG